MKHQLVLILDFDGHGSRMVARRVREEGIYCEIISGHTDMDRVRSMEPIGVILSGDGDTWGKEEQKQVKKLRLLGVPLLGIGGTARLIALTFADGADSKHEASDLHTITLTKSPDAVLFKGMESDGAAWMRMSDCMDRLPEGFRSTAVTKDGSLIAAMENEQARVFALCFHPEMPSTDEGRAMFRHFLVGVCGANCDWQIADILERSVAEIRTKVGDQKVLCGLSGGVDSSVAASLVSRAIGKQLTCIFVDTGLMRKEEGDEVEAAFAGAFDLQFIRVDAEKRFLDRLKGVTDPEKKRKIVGEEFIRVFEEEAKKLGRVDFLVQGTIYPDVIESGIGGSPIIKSHHNVGGLPDAVDFEELLEPLRSLFKDEVRALGRALGLPDVLVSRQPFPGPGLSVRVIGEVTKERLDILREADWIFRNELETAGLAQDISQYFAVLTDMRSVGVRENRRTYESTLALRAVVTDDFMTASWARIPYETLDRAAGRILASVPGINRIVYDITPKPPGTIEWE